MVQETLVFAHQSVELVVFVLGMLYGAAAGLVIFARSWKLCNWVNALVGGTVKYAFMLLIGCGVILTNCLSAIVDFFL